MDSDVERFLAKIEFNPETECWEWLAALNTGGYGHFTFTSNGLQVHISAHRFSWRRYHGDIPTEMCVCHKCDNPRCVNPDHLFLGSILDNMADKSLKGRESHRGGAKGESHHLAKITAKQAEEIRQLYATGKYSQCELGRMFGLSQPSVWQVVNHVSWKQQEK